MKPISTTARMAALTIPLLLAASTAGAVEARELGRQVLTEYQTIQTALAEDSIAGVREAAARIAEIVEPCDCSLEESEASQSVVESASGMTGSDLETLREQFKPLSLAVPKYLEVTGVDSAQLYHCPMAKAYWLQPKEDGTVSNPYFGKSMSRCGVKVAAVAG